MLGTAVALSAAGELGAGGEGEELVGGGGGDGGGGRFGGSLTRPSKGGGTPGVPGR